MTQELLLNIAQQCFLQSPLFLPQNLIILIFGMSRLNVAFTAGGPWCQHSVDFLSFLHLMIKLWFWELWHPTAHCWQGQAHSWVLPASHWCLLIQILTPFDGCVHPFLSKAYGFISGQKEVEIQTPSLGAFCWSEYCFDMHKIKGWGSWSGSNCLLGTLVLELFLPFYQIRNSRCSRQLTLQQSCGLYYCDPDEICSGTNLYSASLMWKSAFNSKTDKRNNKDLWV